MVNFIELKMNVTEISVMYNHVEMIFMFFNVQ
jgi:hypothetical protein